MTMQNDLDNDGIPKTMQAVVLMGHGGYEVLDFRNDVPVPSPADDEVLIRVSGAGINNTDLNTRLGWYSKSVRSETNEEQEKPDDAASWGGARFEFPRIQGADCCGVIVAVGDDIDVSRVGDRVLVRTIMAEGDPQDNICTCTGSEHDGAFAQYMTTRSKHALKVDCDWSDVELASIPCAYSTAEAMLHRMGKRRY